MKKFAHGPGPSPTCGWSILIPGVLLLGACGGLVESSDGPSGWGDSVATGGSLESVGGAGIHSNGDSPDGGGSGAGRPTQVSDDGTGSTATFECPNWNSFTFWHARDCATGQCVLSYELNSDGWLVKSDDDQENAMQMDDEDFAAINAYLRGCSFQASIKRGPYCEPPPGDVEVTFSLSLEGGSHFSERDVAGCIYTGGQDAQLVRDIQAILTKY